jgi:predicted nuclease of predicted toxin-antitoxin system
LKILLDHNLDRRLKNYLTEYETATTQEQGWADVLNGELLTLAEENSFDVLMTADSNIKNQQNLSNRKIAILVLRAFNNRLATHAEMIEDIREVLTKIQMGEIVEVLHKDVKEKRNNLFY